MFLTFRKYLFKSEMFNLMNENINKQLCKR